MNVSFQQTPTTLEHATVAPNRITTPSPMATNTPLATETPTASATPSPVPTIANVTIPPVNPGPDYSHGFNRTRYYTVQSGDTVLSVALEVGMNLEDIYCAVAPDFTLQLRS
ncbi:hypothetical protein KFU94_15955 [Chloroflexi bacterium TSY]|nr:hypothetical protein [Chloroflexi bacterium TSY]